MGSRRVGRRACAWARSALGRAVGCEGLTENVVGVCLTCWRWIP